MTFVNLVSSASKFVHNEYNKSKKIPFSVLCFGAVFIILLVAGLSSQTLGSGNVPSLFHNAKSACIAQHTAEVNSSNTYSDPYLGEWILRSAKKRRARRKNAGAPWVAFVGDSIARNVLVSFLEATGSDRSKLLFERHQDFEHVSNTSGIRSTLYWAPYPNNATQVLASFPPGQKPDLIVLSVSLWHVLHLHDEVLYRSDVKQLVAGCQDFIWGPSESAAPLVVLNAPKVFSTLLTDPDKKRFMTEKRIDVYNQILEEEFCIEVRQDSTFRGKDPTVKKVSIVDVYQATSSCGPQCSVDGIHSNDDVYRKRILPLVLEVSL